jgi:hypothetical protein
MFQPSQADVRRFFCAAHAKARAGAPMEAIETLASLWIAEHPEYHAELADADAAVARNYDDAGPHQSLLAPVDAPVHQRAVQHRPAARHPPGRGVAVQRLDSLHDAHHATMECLGQMLWDSQRSGRPPDGDAYVAAVQRRATRD